MIRRKSIKVIIPSLNIARTVHRIGIASYIIRHISDRVVLYKEKLRATKIWIIGP
jgi:hypothetical protein